MITEIGDSGIFGLNLVGYTENGGNGRKGRRDELAVNAGIILGQLNHPSGRSGNPARQGTGRAHLVLAPTGAGHELGWKVSTIWKLLGVRDWESEGDRVLVSVCEK